MSDLKSKAKDKIDEAADVAKRAAEELIAKSKEVAHSAGKKLDEGAKRLKDA